MFISSYNTYISTNNSDKTNKYKESQSKDEAREFNLKSYTTPTLTTNTANKNLPVDYVSNYKSFNNQQKIQEQIKNQDDAKYTKVKTLQSAKIAYEDNSKMFSLRIKPTVSLDMTPKISKDIPKDIQELKESKLRNKMVNTYMANDKYYQLTA